MNIKSQNRAVKPSIKSPLTASEEEVLELICEDGLGFNEIARQYDVTAPRIRQIYMKGVKKLWYQYGLKTNQ